MIRLKFSCIFLILVFAYCFPLQAQVGKLIDSKKLIKDFEYLEEVIEAHPDPYTHIEERDFKAKLDSVKATLNKPHLLLDFYRKVAYTVALIKDGHSAAYLPRFWMENQRKEVGAFPYEVHLTNENELYVIKNFNEGEIPVGAKVVSINGDSVDDFLDKIDPYISYELQPFRNTIIDGSFEEYLYLAYGHSDKTEIEYFMRDTTAVEVENMPYKEWKKFQKDNQEEREAKIEMGEPYAYKKVSDGVGLINIYAFRARNLQNYKIFLSKTFREIKKDSIHSLIIDVRGNFGGWPKIASYLFHYISDSHFKTMGKSSMKVSYPYRNYFYTRYPALRTGRVLLSTMQDRHRIDLNAVINDPIGSYVDEEIIFNESPVSKDYEFRGDCYLLTNRDSYSSASSFASTFQCYQMGVIVGEETGGTKIFRANPMYEELVKSGIRIAMSTTKLYTTCYNEEMQGVKPTVEYTPSIIELTSDMDTQLLFTQRLIKLKAKREAMESKK